MPMYSWWDSIPLSYKVHRLFNNLAKVQLVVTPWRLQKQNSIFAFAYDLHLLHNCLICITEFVMIAVPSHYWKFETLGFVLLLMNFSNVSNSTRYVETERELRLGWEHIYVSHISWLFWNNGCHFSCLYQEKMFLMYISRAVCKSFSKKQAFRMIIFVKTLWLSLGLYQYF